MYKPVVGIYSIYNIETRQYYIGNSYNVSSRLNRHLNCLRNNSHENSHLQNSFNKYGEDKFEFELVDECSEESLIHMENYWCNLLNVHNRDFGYNIQPINVLDNKILCSEETRQKMSKSQTGSKKSLETRTKQSNMRKGKPIHTEESKSKIIQSNKTRVISEETKLRMSLAARERIKRFGSNLENYNKNFYKRI